MRPNIILVTLVAELSHALARPNVYKRQSGFSDSLEGDTGFPTITAAPELPTFGNEDPQLPTLTAPDIPAEEPTDGPSDPPIALPTPVIEPDVSGTQLEEDTGFPTITDIPTFGNEDPQQPVSSISPANSTSSAMLTILPRLARQTLTAPDIPADLPTPVIEPDVSGTQLEEDTGFPTITDIPTFANEDPQQPVSSISPANSTSSAMLTILHRLARQTLTAPDIPADLPTPVIEPDPSISSPIIGPDPSTPSPIVEPDPETCPPCGDIPLETTFTPGGKVCYCLGGGDPGKDNGDKDPWTPADSLCDLREEESTPALPEDAQPSACVVLKDAPASRDCLNACNFVVTAGNRDLLCSRNVINSARACSVCPGHQTQVQLPGVGGRIVLVNEEAVQKLESSLVSYCAQPGKCYDIRAGSAISGQGDCPVLQVDNNLALPNRDVVFTATRTFTDVVGKPTFALELMTVDDPAFTANTVFAGARATRTAQPTMGTSARAARTDLPTLGGSARATRAAQPTPGANSGASARCHDHNLAICFVVISGILSLTVF